MRRQSLPIVAASVLVAASALFMAWAVLRTTQPSATPTPVAPSPAITATPTADTSLSSGGAVDLGVLSLVLPSDWRYLVDGWRIAVPAELADATLLLAAWQGDSSFEDAPLRLTLFVVDRNELSLERYAGDVAEQLKAAENVTDLYSALDATFRSDTLPVAFLRYATESESGLQFGYQVAALDASGDRIVIATLVTQTRNDGEEILRSIVKSMRFADMPPVPQEGE